MEDFDLKGELKQLLNQRCFMGAGTFAVLCSLEVIITNNLYMNLFQKENTECNNNNIKKQ